MKKTILSLSLITLLAGGINNSYSQSPNKESKDNKLAIYGQSSHASEKQKNFIINSIDSLKNQGYNYFAIEFPSEFDSSLQSYIKSDKEYRDIHINAMFRGSYIKANNLLDVIYNFYKKGFKIVPIDSKKEMDYWNSEFIHYDNPFKLMQDFIDGQPDEPKIDNKRDLYMAKNIEKILEKDSTAKIIACVGALHAGELKKPLNYRGLKFEYLPMAGILKNNGIDPETICLIERDLEKPVEGFIDYVKEFFDKQIYLK